MTASLALVGLQVAGSLMNASAEREQAHAEAAVIEENARRTQLQAAFDSSASLRQSRMEDGAAFARSSGAGGTVSEIFRANAIARWTDAYNIVEAGRQQASGMRTQAGQVRKAGDSAMVRGVFQAGAAALTGVADARSRNRIDAARRRRRSYELSTQPTLGSIPDVRASSVTIGG